jgi:DNA ligase-1
MGRQIEHEWPTLMSTAKTGKTKFWQVRVYSDVMGRAFLEAEYWQDDGAHQTAPKEIKGKSLGKSNETTPIQQAMLEAEATWKKQKDKGYLEDGEEASSPYLLPMLAENYTSKKKHLRLPAYGQPKLDGFRCLYNPTIGFWSRGGKPFDTAVDLSRLRFAPHADITFDGELILPMGYTFQQTCEAIKKQRKETELLEYRIFDVMRPGISFSYRLGLAQGASHAFPEGVAVVETIKIENTAEIEGVRDHYLEQGYEGLMLRNWDGDYQVGQRSNDLLKYKTFIDAEFRVVDVTDGSGREAGAAILVCETAEGKRFQTRMKGDYETRREIFENGDKVIGKMWKVKYQNLTDDGIPRFPVAEAAREDWDQ